MLMYADVCRRMLMHADVCRRMPTYADVCRRMLVLLRLAGAVLQEGIRAGLASKVERVEDAEEAVRKAIYFPSYLHKSCRL
jgi:hypothetical protein